MRWILVIAVASSPAYAEMYKCQTGGKTVYQDTSCPNARVVNNVNGKAPPLEDQINAMYRAANDRAKASPDTRQSNSRRSVNRGKSEDGAGVTDNTMRNPTSGGNSVDSAQRDFDVQTKAKRDYQKQQIPGFITHQPTDAHEMGVYKQEMNRQKNMDPNTWSRLLD